MPSGFAECDSVIRPIEDRRYVGPRAGRRELRGPRFIRCSRPFDQGLMERVRTGCRSPNSRSVLERSRSPAQPPLSPAGSGVGYPDLWRPLITPPKAVASHAHSKTLSRRPKHRTTCRPSILRHSHAARTPFHLGTVAAETEPVETAPPPHRAPAPNLGPWFQTGGVYDVPDNVILETGPLICRSRSTPPSRPPTAPRKPNTGVSSAAGSIPDHLTANDRSGDNARDSWSRVRHNWGILLG